MRVVCNVMIGTSTIGDGGCKKMKKISFNKFFLYKNGQWSPFHRRLLVMLNFFYFLILVLAFPMRVFTNCNLAHHISGVFGFGEN